MTRQDDFLKGLATILECGGEKVVPDAVLEEIGTWDSMGVVQTLALIDEVYGRVVDGRALWDSKTVADVIKVAEGS